MASCREAVVEAVYTLHEYTIRIFFLEEEHYCIRRQGDEITIGIGLGTVELDVKESVLGELVAPFILLQPARVNGDAERLASIFCDYYLRILGEERKRLQKIFQKNIERLYLAKTYPIISRASRLQALYPWLRLALNEYLEKWEYHVWLNSIVSDCLRRLGIEAPKPMIRLAGIAEAVESYAGGRRALSARIARVTRAVVETMSPSLIQAIPSSIVIDSLSIRPHPLLRDPLLLTRLDSSRVATKLLRFDDQLYALTGLSRVLSSARPSSRRVGVIRSVSIIEAGGVRPAVVKRYRDIVAVKWLVAAILSLPLPKPVLGSRSRLNNEYYYNRVLHEKGYNVAEPLLIDPRRRIAAYSYIEGENLATLLQQDSNASKLYYELGMLLSSIHGAGVSLWDSNPSNFVYTGNGFFLVDLEQAREARTVADKAFDIAVAVYYSLLYRAKSAASLAGALVEGYLDAGGDREVVIEAAKYKYAAPFMATVPPNVLEKARRAMLRAAVPDT